MTTFLHDVDFRGFQALNLSSERLASAPTNPAPGVSRRYFDTTLLREGVYNGTSWDYTTIGGVTAVSGTSPIFSSGGSTPVISIIPASSGTAGSMSITDYLKLEAATAANTASTIVQRNSSGNFAAGTITATLTGTASNAANLSGQTPASYLARANHTGTQTSATISDFDTQVRSNRLDQLGAPTAAVGFGGQRLTSLASPTNGSDAATREFVEALVATGTNKGNARAAATGNVNIAAPGAVIDGVTLSLTPTPDIVLLPAQTTGTQNGMYVFNGAASPMTRATNADISAEVTSGLFVFVVEGTVNASAGFTLVTPGPIVLGTTVLTFTQTSGAGQITAGLGQSKVGNVLNVGAGLGILVNPDDVAIDTAIVARKYSQLIGDGTSTSITVTHTCNTLAVIPSCILVASPFTVVMPSVACPTPSTVVFSFGIAPSVNQYRVTIIG